MRFRIQEEFLFKQKLNSREYNSPLSEGWQKIKEFLTGWLKIYSFKIITNLVNNKVVMKNHFTAKLEIIGINPFVFLPEEILAAVFENSGKNKSPIPVKGTVNGKEFKQNLMKYKGEWRLYINVTMLKDSPKRIGETVDIFIEYDNSERKISMHPDLEKAINENPVALKNFEKLTPSRKSELIKYINHLKTEKSIQRNIQKIIQHLKGETDFFGRKI